jgi:hypothetical protein
MIDYLSEHKKLKVSGDAISKLLRKAGAVPIGQRRLGNDISHRRPSVWALRDADRWG